MLPIAMSWEKRERNLTNLVEKIGKSLLWDGVLRILTALENYCYKEFMDINLL
jgi:hypothetical protein